MREFTKNLVSGFINMYGPVLGSIFLVIVVIWILKSFVSYFSNKRVSMKPKDELNVGRNGLRIKWDKELQRQEKEQSEETMKKWRKLEGLKDSDVLYEICGTGLYSPYEVELTDAERDLANELKSYFKMSCILLDNYFSGTYGKTSQVDCIAVNNKGVFVFESKDYSGWIFGNGNQAKWTQVLAYGKDKRKFYNPIKQNSNHVSVVKKMLGDGIPVYSVVVFGEKAELKDISYVPRDCRVCSIWRIGDVFRDFKDDVLEDKKVAEVCRILRQNRIKVTSEMRDKHTYDIKDSLGEDRVYN